MPLAAGTCKISADCTGAATPHCDNGTCRACASNVECQNAEICTPTGACLVGCEKDANCAAGQKCFTSTNGKWCGQCAQTSECTDPSKPFCNGGFCAGCNSNNDCSGSTPTCDTPTHKCVACLDSANGADGTNPGCTGTLQACVNQACVACAPAKNNSGTGVNGACPQGLPVCDTNHLCIACSDSYNGSGDANAACTSPNAACLNKTCLPCVTSLNDASTGANGACPLPATPVCNTGNAGCVGCLSDAHCAAAKYCSGSKTCTLPVLASLAPPAVAVNTNSTVPFTITLDHAARINTAVAVSVAGGGSLDTASATVLAGQTTATFHYTAPATDPGAAPVVTASLNGVDKQSTITVSNVPPALDSITSASPSVQAGQAVTMTVHMTVAVSTDTLIDLATDPSKGSVPTTATVLAGHQTADFVFTAGTTAANNVVVTATYLVAKTALVNITPLSVLSVTPPTPSVMKTAQVPLTVTLDAPAVANVVVALSTDPTYGTVPATVTVLAGATSANFNFTAVEVTPTTTVVTASLNGSTAESLVTVTTNLFNVGGTISGLVGTATLQNNAGDNLDVSADGAFHFAAKVASGNGYAVTVLNDPTLEKCHVTANGSGTTGTSDVTNIAVTCGLKVMVVRVGDGTTAVTSASNASFVDEYDTVTGTVLRTINLPTAPGTTPPPLTLGNSATEGGLSRSVDGKYLTLAGYAITTGTATVANTATAAVNRVIGRIDAAGTVDTSKLLTSAFSGTSGTAGNVRGATTTDGTVFWVSGTSAASSGGGVWYVPANGTPTQIEAAPNNSRHPHIFGGQLYASSASNPTQGIMTVGAGLPTSAATATLLNGFPITGTGCTTCNPYSFAVLDLDNTAGPDTIYETNDTTPGTANTLNVVKWTLDTSGTPIWKQPTTAFVPGTTGGLTAGTRGLAAFVMPSGAVRVFATTGSGDATVSHLVTFLDDGSTSIPAVTTIAASPAPTSATFFRGVAIAPAP